MKFVPPRAYCLLHACHAFCDELISFVSDVLLFVQIYILGLSHMYHCNWLLFSLAFMIYQYKFLDTIDLFM